MHKRKYFTGLWCVILSLLISNFFLSCACILQFTYISVCESSHEASIGLVHVFCYHGQELTRKFCTIKAKTVS